MTLLHMYLHHTVHKYSIKDLSENGSVSTGSGSLIQEGWLSNAGQVALRSQDYSDNVYYMVYNNHIIKTRRY